jgi:nucleoside-diphosphate-sugar epimerase
MKRILVTGSTGCIGSATVKYLLDKGTERVYGLSRSDYNGVLPVGYEHISCDISDRLRIHEILNEVQPDGIIHLAGFQTPECQANPLFGMDVNLVATANLFKTASKVCNKLERFVFASSVAVHGPRSIHPDGPIGPDAFYSPPNLYGFWKTAGEGMAQAFHLETGISTVSLRLATTYGPGRDRGLTSAPTTAMKECVLGHDYRIPYNGREHYHFVDDVGAGFAESAIYPFEGYGAFHLTGKTIEISEFCKMVKQTAEQIGIKNPGTPTVDTAAVAMPFASDLDHRLTLENFPNMPLTSISSGILNSMNRFIDDALNDSIFKANIDL